MYYTTIFARKDGSVAISLITLRALSGRCQRPLRIKIAAFCPTGWAVGGGGDNGDATALCRRSADAEVLEASE
jgi:hypothetical protein